MSQLLPFRALRPAPQAASRVASVPYDVVSTDEARALTLAEPLSFLRVTRSEVDLPPGTPPYDDRVYARAVKNLADLRKSAPLVQDDAPSLYVYRLRMGGHEQTGVAGLYSVDEYNRGLIKKHEKTRKDKEDDRTRHITETGAQTGIVFLTYRAAKPIDEAVARVVKTAPLYSLTAEDGVRHDVWQVPGADSTALASGFAALPALYIADGHHRAASAARSGASHFIAVSFPDDQVQILSYNRTVKDLGGLTAAAFMKALGDGGVIVSPGPAVPDRQGRVSMYFEGRWYTLELPSTPAGTPRSEALDVEVLQQRVLQPVLGVGDPRTDKRIDFVGGIRGPAELERLVSNGKAAVAFSMYPVSVADLMAIADSGGIMPPKSTWFEPKLRDGLLVHLTGTP